MRTHILFPLFLKALGDSLRAVLDSPGCPWARRWQISYKGRMEERDLKPGEKGNSAFSLRAPKSHLPGGIGDKEPGGYSRRCGVRAQSRAILLLTSSWSRDRHDLGWRGIKQGRSAERRSRGARPNYTLLEAYVFVVYYIPLFKYIALNI